MPEGQPSVWLKIERAKEHINDLEARTHGFFEPAPYDLVSERDSETEEIVFRFQRLPHAKDIPPLWGCIAADAIQNLRSTLDILWRRATVTSTKGSGRRRGMYFPFLGPDILKARLKRAKEPALKAALNIASTFKPYKGGNYYLWLLNEMSRIDKHEIPVLVIAAFRRGHIFAGTRNWRERGFVKHGMEVMQFSLIEDGQEFARLPGGYRRLTQDETGKKDEFTFTIAFDEGGPAKGEAVLPTLHEFLSVTNAIAEAFRRDDLIT